ncbi:MAG: neutral/alkaline non-lysosomal ceramidase N-terminal domain-containing protein [Spirochaetota bacterium]
MALSAGVAQSEITPPVGTDLAGWCFGPSRGVADSLYARALTLVCDGEPPLVLVTLDLIGLGTEYASTLRDRLSNQLGTTRERIILSCSHTHSGPGAMPIRRWGKIDPHYIDSLLSSIELTVHRARGAVEPATLVSDQGLVTGICDNRRGDRGNIVDERVPVIVVRRGDGSPMAILYNFSCHPVAAHNDRNLISADFPGYAAKRIQSTLSGAQPMFTLGAAGDVNPVEFHKLDLAIRYGNDLGQRVVDIARGAADGPSRRGEPSETTPGAQEIDVASTVVELPVAELPDPDWLAEERDRWYAEADRLRASNGPHSKIEDALIKAEWAAEALDIVQRGTAQTHLEMEMIAVRLGSAALLALPGELFVEIGMQIKSASPFEPTAIVQLANGAIAYLPTAKAFRKGGYETDFSAKVYGVYMLTEETEQIIEGAARKLFAQLAANATRD